MLFRSHEGEIAGENGVCRSIPMIHASVAGCQLQTEIEQVRLCADTLKRKTKEYTGDDPDRLGAFKAAAALQHTTPQRALAGCLLYTSRCV